MCKCTVKMSPTLTIKHVLKLRSDAFLYILKKKHFSYKINKLTSEQPILSTNTDG